MIAACNGFTQVVQVSFCVWMNTEQMMLGIAALQVNRLLVNILGQILLM